MAGGVCSVCGKSSLGVLVRLRIQSLLQGCRHTMRMSSIITSPSISLFSIQGGILDDVVSTKTHHSDSSIAPQYFPCNSIVHSVFDCSL